MSVWALSDFHLSFGIPNKSMEIFGPSWKNWTDKIETNCHELIKDEDLLLIAGDISWASNIEEAMADLNFIDKLPGTKILLKGNHDYWWPSYSKLIQSLPKSIKAIQNNSIIWKGIAIGGTRLWDSPEYQFKSLISLDPSSFGKEEIKIVDNQDKKIFERELQRLDLSLKTLPKEVSCKIVMTHYPPIGENLSPSRASTMIENHSVDVVVFGHLHSLSTKKPLFGKKRSTSYFLTSCDYLDFKPIQIH